MFQQLYANLYKSYRPSLSPSTTPTQTTRTPSIMATSAASSPSLNTSTSSAPVVKQPLPKSVIFATSGLGGCLGWVVVHPFNTIAVRANLASASGQTFSLSKMLKQDGFMSLYDGLSAGVARQVFYATSRFGLFEIGRDLLHHYRGKTDFAARVGVGAVTGGIAAFISCPMEVCVVRMSNDASLPPNEQRHYKSLYDAFTRTMREEGVGAFWRGSGPFVSRAMLVGVFQVATLDQFKDFYAQTLQQQRNSIPNVFCAAMTSGLIYSIATMPLEAAKNRMASQEPDPKTGKLPFTGAIQTITKVASDKGFLALYNGFFPYYLRCGGHTVSMFIIVQMLRDAFCKYNPQYRAQ